MALLEVGGESRQLRPAVGARGPRRRRPARGRHRARGPRRAAPAQRHRLGARVLRRPAGGRGGRARQHALHRGRGRLRGAGLGRCLRVRARLGAARRRAARLRGPRARRPRGDLLHERHHRLSQGRDDHACQLHDQHRELLPRAVCRALGAGRHLHAGVGAAVPRDRLQQPAVAGHGVGWAGGDPVRAARPGRLLHIGRRAPRQPARVRARHLPRGAAPPALRRAGCERRALDLLRRRADRREPRAQHPGGLPQRARRQRLRAHRDLLADLLPAPRGGRRPRRLGRLRDAGRRSRDRPARPRDARRRAARARAQRRGGLLEQAAGQRGDIRGRLAAHRRPGARGRRRPAVHRRPQEGHDQPRRRERVLDRGGERARLRARCRRGGGGGRARRDDGREGGSGDRARGRRAAGCRRDRGPLPRAPCRLQGAAVRGAAQRAAAAQPGRQGAEGAAARCRPTGASRCASHPSREESHGHSPDRAGARRGRSAGARAGARARALPRRGGGRRVARALRRAGRTGRGPGGGAGRQVARGADDRRCRPPCSAGATCAS